MPAAPGAGITRQLAALYQPIVEAIVHRQVGGPPGFVVGLCGPQGAGKTTGAAVLQGLLKAMGLRTAILSLDDLYLGRDERLALASQVHPLLATRGPPGTHETALGLALIEGLGAPGRTRMPEFDKATDDRRPDASWPSLEGPFEVILFEGWCVGARPQAPSALVAPINALEETEDAAGVWRTYVNRALGGDYQGLFSHIDFQILLVPPSFEVVAGWRIEQERDLRRRRAGDPSAARLLTDAQVRRFVQFYERITRHILIEMPDRADVLIRLDESRNATIERLAATGD